MAMSTQEQGTTENGSRGGSVSDPAPLVLDDGTELREGYAGAGDTRLHYVEAGDGPLVVLLHGFTEFWFGWRLQIGYNMSMWMNSKPTSMPALAASTLGLWSRLMYISMPNSAR
jgi:hypothetical protein